ncbi:MAG: cobalamin-binding protein [Terriglobia bacterium]
MRICSLLPSATEICFALGLNRSLVGVSHECDYPDPARALPKLTRSNLPANVASSEIDRAVSSALEVEGSLYDLDLPLLKSLEPDLILTQRLCDVCAVSFDRVQEAVNSLPSRPRILNLEPRSLDGVFASILEIAEAANVEDAGRRLVASLRERVEQVRQTAAKAESLPRVFCMEWVDPPYCGGHWIPELVEIAGGVDRLANRHRPSRRIEWQRVLDYAPEVVILTCCGFELERTIKEAAVLAGFAGVERLPAVQNDRVYATDGSHFFARPGPRIVDSLEMLAHLIHPELFNPPPLSAAFEMLHLPLHASAR